MTSLSVVPIITAEGAAPPSDEDVATDMAKRRESAASIKDEETASSATEKPLEKARDPADDFPDGGYAWVICGCVFFTAAVTWGVNGAFGVFLSFYLDNDYFPGATPLQFAFVGGLSLSLAMAVGPISNFVSKRYGFRSSYIAGSVMLVAGQVFAGFAVELWQLFLTQGVLFGFGLGFIMVSTNPVLVTWFGRKRALAVAIGGGGSGLGGLVIATVTRVVIEKHSLRIAFVVNSCICAGVLVPCIILMRQPPNAKPHNNITFEPFKPSLFRNPGYLSIILWGIFIQFAYTVGLYSIPPYATQGLGLSQAEGSTLQSIFNAGQLVLRPFCGFLLDRYGRINGAAGVTFFSGLTCLLIWMFATSFAPLAVFAFFQGGSSGIFWTKVCLSDLSDSASLTSGMYRSNQTLIVEVTNMQSLTGGLSMLWLIIVAPATVAEPIAVALADYSRNTLGRAGPDAYRISIGFAGGAFCMAGLCLLGAKRYKQGSWKILQKV